MPTTLLFLEFIGTTELLVIGLVALIIFGPRRLPEIGRTVGKSLAEFKRASEEFKRTWEYEVETERRQTESRAAVEPRIGAGPEAERRELDAPDAPPADEQMAFGGGLVSDDYDAAPAAATTAPAPAPLTIPRGAPAPPAPAAQEREPAREDEAARERA